MKAVIQRVKRASVSVEGKIVGSIADGMLILLGVNKEDTRETAVLLAEKLAKMRIFTDANQKMNLSLLNISGGALVISNFTLCADIRRGTRPSFDLAMPPKQADELYEFFCDQLRKNGVEKVEKGVFGADMSVELINDGPVTVSIDTDIWNKPRNS